MHIIGQFLPNSRDSQVFYIFFIGETPYRRPNFSFTKFLHFGQLFSRHVDAKRDIPAHIFMHPLSEFQHINGGYFLF